MAWRLLIAISPGIARLINASLYAPTTANGWLSILRVILKAAKRELGLPLDATEGVAYFDTSEHETYTEEEPNALPPEKVSEFLACMREVYPQHFAMTYLGFATGLRPSSMRPLRRKGTSPDVRWDEGVILVRRSHSLGEEVMSTGPARPSLTSAASCGGLRGGVPSPVVAEQGRVARTAGGVSYI